MNMAENVVEDDVSLPGSWRTAAPILVAVGAVCVLLSLGLFSIAGGSTADEHAPSGFKIFAHSYLTNFIYGLSFTIGGLFFTLITQLARAGWCATIRRLAELMAVTVTWWAALFLPIVAIVLAGGTDLYKWADPEHSGLAADKLMYLNSKWFIIRAVVYFAVWVIASSYFFAKSREQDETGSTDISLSLQKASGPLIVLFALSLNFAAFDWVMSVDATWYSTIFGVYLFAASMMAFFAFSIATFSFLQKQGKVQKYVTVEHYHDMSKFMFGFVFFWTYIAFSQFLLYWYGNIPEETLWFKHRMEDGWQYVGLFLILFHFALPMLGMMSRHVRRNRQVMTCWAIFLLFVHWVDMTFLIMPNLGAITPTMTLGHVLCGVGMFSLFLALFCLRVGSTPLVAKKNPWIQDALSYHVT
ncbi:MAG: quinol:cytochrome C oxidoreductase [Pirellulales bacterium]